MNEDIEGIDKVEGLTLRAAATTTRDNLLRQRWRDHTVVIPTDNIKRDKVDILYI